MSILSSIGLSGLRAAQGQLNRVGHNITNANTTGYSRQEATQQSVALASGQTSGTILGDTYRVSNNYLTTELWRTTSENSEAEAYQEHVETLNTVLSSTTSSLSSSMQRFFSALQTAANDPAGTSGRQLVLAEAQGVAKRFNDLHSTLSSQQTQVNQQISATADQVNTLAKTIGQLNGAIAKAIGSNVSPNDLMDQRDEAIRQLSAYVDVDVVQQDSGYLNVFVGTSRTSQPLVIGETANQLSADPSDQDPSQLAISFVSTGDGSKRVIGSSELGGALGGLIRFNDSSLASTFNTLGQMALVFSDAVNNQLGKGVDLSGDTGVGLFSDINNTQMMTERVVVSGENNSNVSGALKITDASKIMASDYSLSFNGATYSAVRVSDGASINVLSSSGVLSFSDVNGVDQGFNVTISGGSPAQGDSFTLQPTKRGASNIATDPIQSGQLAFAAPLKSVGSLQNTGTGVLSQPKLTAVTDASGAKAEMLVDDLKGISPVTISYSNTPANSISLALPSPLPATWTSASITPTSVSITPGQTNSISYTLTVNNGSAVTKYTFGQDLTGVPANGDSFKLSFNDGGVSDNRNLLALSNLKTDKLVGAGSSSAASLTATYSSLVSQVGNTTAQGRQDIVLKGAILDYATNSRDSYSGVNLDEEAANLMKYQQLYTAASKVIQVSDELFDSLMNAIR